MLLHLRLNSVFRAVEQSKLQGVIVCCKRLVTYDTYMKNILFKCVQSRIIINLYPVSVLAKHAIFKLGFAKKVDMYFVMMANAGMVMLL